MVKFRYFITSSPDTIFALPPKFITKIIMELKHLAPVAAIVCLVAAPAQAGDEHKAIAKELAAAFKDLNTQLDTVKDSASADKAAPEIEKISKKITEISQKGEKLGQPTDPKEIEEMQKELMPIIQPEMQKLMGNMMRIAMAGDIESPALEKAMASMSAGAAPKEKEEAKDEKKEATPAAELKPAGKVTPAAEIKPVEDKAAEKKETPAPAEAK